jgi:hypothetical protein
MKAARAVARLETALVAKEEVSRVRFRNTNAPNRELQQRDEKYSPGERDAAALAMMHTIALTADEVGLLGVVWIK